VRCGGRDVEEMWKRCGRDVEEMWKRCRKNIEEIWLGGAVYNWVREIEGL